MCPGAVVLCWVAGLGGPEVGWEVGLERVTGVRESQDFERQLTDLVEAGMITLILAGRWGAVALAAASLSAFMVCSAAIYRQLHITIWVCHVSAVGQDSSAFRADW